MFYFDKFNGKKVLKSDVLNNVTAFFTTREGLPKFENRIILPTQTHSDHIEIVDERCEYPDTDALILTNTDDTICLKFADCTPLIFYDTKQKIGAIAHAGWRGTAAKIGVKTVQKMGEFYRDSSPSAQNDSQDYNFTPNSYSYPFLSQNNEKFIHPAPENIIALIGPAIGLCCYEVSEEVRGKLLETVKDTTGLYEGRNVDLKKINARQLEEIGIKQIDICPYCTSCNNDLFYSYRKENGTSERHYAVLKL